MSEASIPGHRLAGVGAWRPSAVLVLLVGDFALLGVTIGVQGVLWASLMSAIGAGKAAFGTAQLASPLVSIALLLLGGQLAAAFGKKRLGTASLLLLGGSSLALAASGDLWGFVGALILLGAGNGLFETAMNGAALDWEQANGRSVLNALHAGYSAGAIAGALGAGLLLGAGWRHGQVLAALAALCGLALVATLPVDFPPAEQRTAGMPRPGSALRLLASGPVLAGLAAVCMLGAVGESVANIWTVIYLTEQGAGAVVSGTAYALLSGAMLVGRLGNIPLLNRFGPRGSLWASGVGLIVASILLVIPGGISVAIAGFGLLGLAVAGVVPTAISAAARLAPGSTGAVAGAMLASVYIGFIILPPVVGWLAEMSSLRVAMSTVGLSGLGILWLARGVGQS